MLSTAVDPRRVPVYCFQAGIIGLDTAATVCHEHVGGIAEVVLWKR